MVDQPVGQQVDRPPEHHLQARALDRVDVVGEVAALEASGSRRPGSAGSRSSAAGRSSRAVSTSGLGALGVLQFVHVDDHAEHEHRASTGQTIAGMPALTSSPRSAARTAAATARPMARAAQGTGRKQMPISPAASPRTIAEIAGPEDQEHPGQRDREEQRLLPAVGREVVERQGAEGQGHQGDERAALDLVPVEEPQHEAELRHRAPRIPGGRDGMPPARPRRGPRAREPGESRPRPSCPRRAGSGDAGRAPERPVFRFSLSFSRPFPGESGTRAFETAAIRAVRPRDGEAA